VIKKRGNSWWVVVYTGRDPLTGKKRQKTGTARTRAEARQLEARLIREAGTGQHRAAGNKTVAELLDAWREWRPRRARSPNEQCSATPAWECQREVAPPCWSEVAPPVV
jgi:Arm DNA-binding domain